uniref:helix-turn-helix domain-containing protein n=1 Tax=Nonomuraea lactucae TaxID=2249762 RepID=UPI0013B3A576
VLLRGELAAAVRGPGSDAARPSPLDLLTDREREIAELAAGGKRSREIADQLFLSPRTVEAHLGRVYRKLEVSSRAALAAVLLQAPPAADG